LLVRTSPDLLQNNSVLIYKSRSIRTGKLGPATENRAIIYTDKPVTYSGEYFQKNAIKVIPSNLRDKLSPEARLDYNKVYPIHYNVEAFFTGRVDKVHLKEMLATCLEIHKFDSQDPKDTSEDKYQDTKFAGGS
jgi:hypothetical protein